MSKKYELVWNNELCHYNGYIKGMEQLIKTGYLTKCHIDMDRAEEALRSRERIDDEFVASRGDKGSPDEMLKIIDAISKLDPDDKAHFTAGGLPNAVVLSENLGMRVTSAMRDEAWAAFNG